jgi:tRNA A37 threonylcarbamoyladenosine synthetase subunit TsaC/SUA5/YrdC
VCADFAQLGQFVQLDNAAFRSIKAVTPGPYTFILSPPRRCPAGSRTRRRRRSACGSPTRRVQALVRELGKPLVSSSLLLPGDEEPMTDGWQIKEALDAVVDAVLDAGDCGTEPTTVVDWSSGAPEVVRVGAG